MLAAASYQWLERPFLRLKERFSHVAVPRSFPAGTRVFHEGDSSDACYIVSEGSFRVTREHSDGRAITLATLGPGEIFGEVMVTEILV